MARPFLAGQNLNLVTRCALLSAPECRGKLKNLALPSVPLTVLYHCGSGHHKYVRPVSNRLKGPVRVNRSPLVYHFISLQ
jgi:hypothetical protein